MLQPANSYDELVANFAWQIPEKFNIGTAVSDRWAENEPDRICIERFDLGGNHEYMTYGELSARSNAFANALAENGVKPGDRVAILMPQSFETAIAHIAIYKIGAIAVPLALLFGVEALSYRLSASGARAVVTNGLGLKSVLAVRGDLPDLSLIVSMDGAQDGVADFADLISGHSTDFTAADTTPETPGLMIFTSGTTGPPKGALHGHQVLLGHLPGIQMHHEFLPQKGDRLWTPADWAWAGGLLNALLPGLYFGVPIVTSPAQKFDSETAYRIMSEMKVRNVFIPPTALRLMRASGLSPANYELDLRTMTSAGEALGKETYDWARETFGLTVNEFYGQTECNIVVSACAAIGVTQGGSMGRPVPGHDVAVIDEAGNRAAAGEPGQIAVRRPDPVMFLNYWGNPEATAKKFIGDWMTTGDQGTMDADGYITFFGRDDDVITSAGFRIGPGEIEDCLTGYPAVALVAVVGKPDPVRTEIVKAYVVLKPGVEASAETSEDIRLWVRNRLSKHEYPREIEFVDTLPTTTTGKIIRREMREKAIREAAEKR